MQQLQVHSLHSNSNVEPLKQLQHSARQPLRIGDLLVGTTQKIGAFQGNCPPTTIIVELDYTPPYGPLIMFAVDIHSIDDATREFFESMGVSQVILCSNDDCVLLAPRFSNTPSSLLPPPFPSGTTI
jgi:hypothetical protein